MCSLSTNWRTGKKSLQARFQVSNVANHRLCFLPVITVRQKIKLTENDNERERQRGGERERKTDRQTEQNRKKEIST